MNEKKYLTAVYSFSYFGPKRTKLLTSFFGSAQKVWHADKKSLLSLGLKENVVQKFIDYRKNFNLESYFNRLKKLSVNFTVIEDKDYPENLKGLSDAPLVLYYKGTLKKSDKNAVAIVGSRKITSYGREVTKKFASELALFGITVVSGLAFGIDVTAHEACLAAGGRALAVLASGLDLVTPISNTWLGEKIIASGGAIVSEHPLGYRPNKSDFPERNRIISGLSRAVLVVEGARKSGTLHTASHAAEQGVAVFAVPGQIFSPMSEAPHFLIQNGAKLATSTRDILDELDLQLKVDIETLEKVMPEGENEAKILKILTNEPLHLDEIVRISNLRSVEVFAKLTVMELKGLIKNIGNGIYKRVL